jgi:hypothetical protein
VTRIVVSAPVASKAGNGGIAWIPLSYVRGLSRLGCEAYLLEQTSDGAPDSVTYFEDVARDHGLAGRAALVGDDGRTLSGPPAEELLELAEASDLLVNVSGNLRLPSLLERFRRRAYVDEDPGFTQFWLANGSGGFSVEGHDVYFSVGANIGRPSCEIPTMDIEWRPIRPPVVLDDWPVARANGDARFTTVASWRGAYGPVDHGGKRYGLKVHEFRKFVELPERVPPEFEIALDIAPEDERDRRALEERGWRLVDPRDVARTPDEFRSYVQRSSAEFSVAQGIYVDTSSGWFSDRSTRYLASGKPVLVQDTGFGERLPAGEGIVPFRTLDDAVAGAESIAADYERHARAARALAEEHFDSDRVLADLLADAL